MDFLIDTHTLIWFANSNPALSSKARTLIEDPFNKVSVSVVSIWEIAIKVSSGKLNLGKSFKEFVQDHVRNTNFFVMDVNLWHTIEVETLPFHHRDPFDRLLIAQAITENLPIVSGDAVFDNYAVTRIW
jgi:PIN domain nuclease of toxin-antitoxin system